MMKSLAGALVALILVACSSSDDTPATPAVGSGHGNCAAREATYIVHFAERQGGTCGAISDAVIQGGSLSAGTSKCTGPVTPTADNCEVAVDQTCATDAATKGGSTHETGRYKFSVDGSYGSGVSSVSVLDADGKALCASTYDLTVTRQ